MPSVHAHMCCCFKVWRQAELLCSTPPQGCKTTLTADAPHFLVTLLVRMCGSVPRTFLLKWNPGNCPPALLVPLRLSQLITLVVLDRNYLLPFTSIPPYMSPKQACFLLPSVPPTPPPSRMVDDQPAYMVWRLLDM